jgi:type IV secretion system protein TrbL
MADCAFYDAKCHAADFLAGLGEGLFGELEAWVVESAIDGIKFAVLAWVRVPTPTVSEDSGPVAYLLAYTYPIAFALATLSLLIMAGRLAWSQRGEDLVEIGRSLVTFVAITTLGVAVVSALTVAGDSYSRWILESSLGMGPDPSDTQIAERTALLLNITSGTSVGQGIKGLTIVFAFGWLSATSLILIFLTWVRGVLLVLLAGGAPIAAAAGMTKTGRETLGKYGAWTLAWITFKPATSTAMATGFWMFGTGDALDMLGGIALIGMTIFMLPFLLRLFVPAASAFAGGGGGSSLVAAGAAGAVPVASWLAGRSGGDSNSNSKMSVRDVSQGPSGSTTPATAPPSPQPSAPTTGGGAAGASKAAGAAGVAVAAGAEVVKAGKQAARGTAAAATGEGS